MFTLSYSPAYDPYHTIFRNICALRASQGRFILYDKLRFVDFYLCFPWLLKGIKGARNISGFVKTQNALVKKYTKNPYETIPNPKSLFERMEPIQLAAYSAMISDGLVSNSSLKTKEVVLIEKQYDQIFEERIEAYLNERSDLLAFLTDLLVRIELNGPNGLKFRTGLEEYRYDDV